MNPQTTQVDPKIKALVSAMGEVESGPQGGPDAYKTRGASGEFGRYQFMPKTWQEWSKESGISTPLEQSSIEEQNKVAYNKVKQWKDQGYNPAQIASMWNSGDPDAYKRDHVGINSQGVKYNTPEHVRKVSEAYQRRSQAGGSYLPPAPPAPNFTPSQTSGVQNVQNQLGVKPEGLINQLGAAVKDTGTQMGEAIGRVQSGESGVGSGLLQGAGAAAGLVGTAVDTTLKNTPVIGPVYQGVSDVIGGAVSGIAETGPGQAVVEGFNKLSPNTQRNIGATGNILSVIPFFKAFSTGRKGLVDGNIKLNEKTVEADAATELTDQLTTVPKRSLDRAENRGLDPVGTLVKNPTYLPNIIETSDGKFKWDSNEAVSNIQKSIDADELALQNLLASQVKQAGKTGKEILGFNIADIRARTVKDVLGQQGITGGYTGVKKALDSYFDALEESLQASGGRRFISLNEVNDIKRDIRQAINFDAVDPFGTIAKEAKANAGQSLMKQVEEAAAKAGIKGVPELNKKIGTNIEAQKLLNALNDKTVKAKKEGLIKGLLREVPGANFVMPRTPSTATSRLKRRRPLRETAKRGLVQTSVGMGLSNQLGQEEEKKNI
jgi:uncharacterized protein (UPF0297 family)